MNHNGITSKQYSHWVSKASVLVMTTAMLMACNPSSNDTLSGQAEDSIATDAVTLAEATVPHNIIHPLLTHVATTVYKDINCGCCQQWVEYASEHGMQAQVQHPENLAVFKDRYQVPAQLQSCHTTVTTDGYVFEGHVPAKYMAKFLAEPPANAIGLAVPNMPMGSPGMEYEDQFTPYQVMQINKDGSSQVYANSDTPEQQL